MRWIVLYKYGDKIRLTSYILKYLTPELLIKIERTTRRYELNNNQKGKIIQRLLEEHLTKEGIPHQFLGKGTNRLGYKIDDLAFKFALDDDGHIDNKREFKYTNDLQPYVIKVYECSGDGLVAVTEFVRCFDDYATMLHYQDQIRSILMDVSDDYFIGDVGITEKNAANWGLRENDELVMLDFAYIYSVSYRLFTCTCDAHEILHYDQDYKALECPACHRHIDFSQIRRRISKKDQNEEIGDLTKQAYILHKPVEYQVVNPEYSDVEFPETEEELYARRKKKMSKKKKFKSFDKQMEKVTAEDQLDMMTNLLTGQLNLKPELPEEDDSIGDREAGEALMLKSLMNGGPMPDEGIDIEDVDDDPDNINPVFHPSQMDAGFEPENPTEYSPSEYAAMAEEYFDHPASVVNNFGAPKEEEPKKEMSIVEFMSQNDAPAKHDDDKVDILEELEAVEVEEETRPVETKSKPDFPMVSVSNLESKCITFGYGMGKNFFKGPDITKLKTNRSSGNHSTDLMNSGIADAVMAVAACLSKPAIICDGVQMDKYIFPKDIFTDSNRTTSVISVYNAERFKIVELMGNREIAPADPKKRFFAIYDLGKSVQFLNNLLGEFAVKYSTEAVSDYILAMLAQIRLDLLTGNVEYNPTDWIEFGNDDNAANLSSDEMCRQFHEHIVDDAETVLEDDEAGASAYTLNVSSWGVDEHDSDISIYEDIMNGLINEISMVLQNYNGGYMGFRNVEPIRGLLDYRAPSVYRSTEPLEEHAEESEEIEESDPDNLDLPDDDMIVETVQRP